MSNRPESKTCDSMLYEALRIARVPDRLAQNAYMEVYEMTGTNVNARFDQFEKRIDQTVLTIRWGVGIFLSLLLLFGTIVAVLGGVVLHILDRLP